jgi:spermidine synthase
MKRTFGLTHAFGEVVFVICRFYQNPFFILKTIQSKFNGRLEVYKEDGRTVLNTENTHYSGHILKAIFLRVLKNVDLSQTKKILLLGLGGGTVVELLTNEFEFKGHITAVEIDPVIISIAKKDFGIKPSSKLTIECADAVEYIRTSRKKFDLIICDIFVDQILPEEVAAESFWKNMAKRSSKNGTIIFNAFHETAKMKKVTNTLSALDFNIRILPKVKGSNTFMIAEH